jgi:hypothetical protein
MTSGKAAKASKASGSPGGCAVSGSVGRRVLPIVAQELSKKNMQKMSRNVFVFINLLNINTKLIIIIKWINNFSFLL